MSIPNAAAITGVGPLGAFLWRGDATAAIAARRGIETSPVLYHGKAWNPSRPN
jgi:hypothetical protein